MSLSTERDRLWVAGCRPASAPGGCVNGREVLPGSSFLNAWLLLVYRGAFFCAVPKNCNSHVYSK